MQEFGREGSSNFVAHPNTTRLMGIECPEEAMTGMTSHPEEDSSSFRCTCTDSGLAAHIM
jgi:hypothetical protein